MSEDSLKWHVWKHLSESQVNQLEAALEVPQCRALLAQFLGLAAPGADAKADIVLDFHMYNYAFCKEQRFDARKTSAYMSIMTDILTQDLSEDDTGTDGGGREASFERFRELILSHCVERPPWSIGVFTLEDVAGITNYTVNSYYRHHRLYKHLFTSRVATTLLQRNLGDTEEPRPPPPLCEAVPADAAPTEGAPTA